MKRASHGKKQWAYQVVYIGWTQSPFKPNNAGWCMGFQLKTIFIRYQLTVASKLAGAMPES